MTKNEAKEIARDAKDELKESRFNDPTGDAGFDLYEFDLDQKKMNVFAYIGKRKDQTHRWYSVYAGVERADGCIIYADYDYSTANWKVDELTDAIYELANLYTKPENLENLRKMIVE